jgi:hypothetical protein
MNLRKLGLGGGYGTGMQQCFASTAEAQLKDVTQIGPTEAGGAINKSLAQQIGAGSWRHLHAEHVRGSYQPRSGEGDPPRQADLPAQSSRWHRKRANDQRRRRQPQLHRRRSQHHRGFADSCAACHGRPRGSADTAATSSRALTAGTRPTCSGSACKNSWPTR